MPDRREGQTVENASKAEEAVWKADMQQMLGAWALHSKRTCKGNGSMLSWHWSPFLYIHFAVPSPSFCSSLSCCMIGPRSLYIFYAPVQCWIILGVLSHLPGTNSPVSTKEEWCGEDLVTCLCPLKIWTMMHVVLDTLCVPQPWGALGYECQE